MKKIKNIIKKILPFLIPVKNIILFESVPNLSDNTKAVFDEMIRRGLNRRYKMAWIVSGKYKPAIRLKNVVYIDQTKRWGRIKILLLNWCAKCLISCNCFLSTMRSGQTSIYLSHGTPLKSVRNYYNIPTAVNYCIAASKCVRDLLSYEFNYNIDDIIPLGFPRNDIFSTNPRDIKSILQTNCEKLIVWYPTFRQHKNGLKTGASKGLPIINDIEKATELNKCAQKANVLLVLKPHFAQDLSYVKELNLTNIRFIDDNFFATKNISSYEFVAGCDALITDYSSIYYDYTLCDKPIAMIWEDIEEYRKKPGLIENYEHYTKGAEKIYTLQELEEFVKRIGTEEDLLKQERNEIKELVNYSTDGKNAERVVDFIIEKAGLKG